MTETIISGPEWNPLQVKEGLSLKRKNTAFLKEIEEFGTDIFLSKVEFPRKEDHIFIFNDYFVHVNHKVIDKFILKFKPYINGNKLEYDNLINLCIMVKNAGDGFKDILIANLPYIDRYTILDTGSTDNTIKIIKEVLVDKRGELYREPFINFRDSRNRLLELADTHCHFNIMLDDTFILCGNIREFLDFARGDDVATSFSLTIEYDDISITSNRITKSHLGLRYVNMVHEIIQTENNAMNVAIPYKFGYIKETTSEYMKNRTKERKHKDISTLKKMLEEDPENPRTYYYLATSYINTEDWEEALKWFLKRIKLKGFKDEIQDSLYYIAVIKDKMLNNPWEECFDLYLKCYEFNPVRPEALYFIGKKYLDKGMKNTAYIYLKKAFEIGNPPITISYRKDIYNYHIPKDIVQLSYIFKDYKLGEKACRKLLGYKHDKIVYKWFQIFNLINNSNVNVQKTRIGNEKLIVFISPGGWKEWDGETLRRRGLGGSENFTVRYSEQLSKYNNIKTIVFCNCLKEIEYNNVTYLPLKLYTNFVSKYFIDIVIINRYPEYIPVSCLNNSKTYYISHDLVGETEIIINHPNFKKFLSISDWHNSYMSNYYGNILGKNLFSSVSYTIDINDYKETEIEKYMFIYPSFPNRGLLELLKMWPKILNKYPEATLHCFCDMKNEWCQKYHKKVMDEIEVLLEKYDISVMNHGWVNGATLREYWNKAHIWLYPCVFKETCCLTAWEAAASKTLVVTNNLAALKDSVGDRGVVAEGNAQYETWQNTILNKMFNVLDRNKEYEYIIKNYEWVKTKNPETVVDDFVRKYIE